MGKVTIIVECKGIPTPDLEKFLHEAMDWAVDEAHDRFGVDIEDIFVVPSDEG